LRGIAAATVVLGHLLKSAPAFDDHSEAFWALKYTPLHIFWAGHQAVIFFFVLSGFVLALPFYSRVVSYRAFVIRRVFRICIPYWAAVVLAAIACHQFSRHGVPGLSTWFNSWWNDRLSAELLLGHLLLIGSFRNNVLDPVLWSLVHEMRISLAFPLLMAFLLRNRWHTTLLAAAGLGVIGLAISHFSHRLGGDNDFGATFGYVLMFAVGALLCRHRVEIIGWFQQQAPLWRRGWMLLALLAYTYPFWFLPSAPFLHLGLVDDYVTTAGVALFIVLALGSRSSGRALQVPPLPWLGRVSYSLYLLHAIVLLTLLSLLFGAIPLWAIWALTLLISLPLAAASYRLLERPSITLGHRLAAHRWPVR
jgi:peptidoglycan/LPS O-acetylase OafA/YrhL